MSGEIDNVKIQGLTPKHIWDEHDFSEFEDVEEVKDIRFSLIKKKYVGVDTNLYSKIKKESQEIAYD